MKTAKFFSLLFMMVSLVSFTACSSDDDEDDVVMIDQNGNPRIVGTWTFDTDQVDTWTSKSQKIVEIVTFSENGTGKVTGTMTDDGVPIQLNATFDYTLTWKDNVGTLRVTNLKGITALVEEGIYTLNQSVSGNSLSSTLLKINGIAYKR